MKNVANWSAELAGGHVSAAELLDLSLRRIESTQPRVNAFTDLCAARARSAAQRVDEARRQKKTLGPLAGIPYAVKNLFDVQGLVTRAGSVIRSHAAPAQQDAVLVQRLEEAGAVLTGTLNMDEFAYGFTTENTHYGPCHNPHDLARIAGGSSGGSGAAVAASQVGLALASDTNGSIRVPASLCGVWGLKPTFGRLSRRGSYPFVHSIDHLGPLGDCVEALAWSYDAMQGPDPLDPGCHALSVQPVSTDLGQGVEGLRIGVLGGYFDDHATPAARAVVQAAAKVLGATEGVIWPDAALGRAAAFIISASEGGSLHLDDLRQHADRMEPLSVDRFLAGALQPADWTLRAQRFRRVYRDRINALLEDWDVLLAPATPVQAPVIGSEWIDINGVPQLCRPSMGLLTQPVSFMGCPVVVAPLWPGTPDAIAGLPLGVQIISAPWREDHALRTAMVLQQSGLAHTQSVNL